jgi:hypothetical protein
MKYGPDTKILIFGLLCDAGTIGVWQGVALDLLKFHPGLAMPDPSKPCGQATTQIDLWLFQQWPACSAGGLRLPLWTPHAARLWLAPQRGQASRVTM